MSDVNRVEHENARCTNLRYLDQSINITEEILLNPALRLIRITDFPIDYRAHAQRQDHIVCEGDAAYSTTRWHPREEAAETTEAAKAPG